MIRALVLQQIGNPDGCAWYRLLQFTKSANRQKLADCQYLDLNLEEDDLKAVLLKADVFLVRLSSMLPMVLDHLKEQDIKKPVVLDIDDAIDGINPLADHYRTYGTKEVQLKDGSWLWKDGVGGFDHFSNRGRVEAYRECINRADAIITTTFGMKEWLEYETKAPIAVIPNAINLDIFPKVQDPVKKEIRLVWSGGACVDDKTEILTDGGFKFFKDLNGSEAVATLNPENNCMEFHKPTSYIADEYDGDLITVNKNQIKFSVTPEHKLYCKDYQKEGNYGLVKADNLGNVRIKKSFEWIGTPAEYFTIPETSFKRSGFNGFYTGGEGSFKEVTMVQPPVKMLMNDWLRFFGFWLAEGWTSKTSYKGPSGKNQALMQVGIVQVKSNEILEEMRQMMGKYGFVGKYTKDRKQLRFCNRQLWEYLSKFGGATEKYIPREFLTLPRESLEILFKYYVMGDGHVENTRTRTYTVSKQLADDFMEVGVKIGYQVNLASRFRLGGGFVRGRQIISTNRQYTVSFFNGGKHTDFSEPVIYKKDYKKTPYKGLVYCVDVPNHIIYIRKNGVCHWTGNSHFADLQEIEPALARVMAKYPNLHYYSYGMHFGAIARNLPKDRYHTAGWVHPEAHGYRLACLDPDISICPLIDSEFNRVKSSIKYYEMSALGVPTLARDIPPYTDDIKDGENGLLYDSVDDFEVKLSQLVEDGMLRIRLGHSAYDYVRANRQLDDITKDWVEFLEACSEK